MKRNIKNNKFSLRKVSIGLCSLCIGLICYTSLVQAEDDLTYITNEEMSSVIEKTKSRTEADFKSESDKHYVPYHALPDDNMMNVNLKVSLVDENDSVLNELEVSGYMSEDQYVERIKGELKNRVIIQNLLYEIQTPDDLTASILKIDENIYKVKYKKLDEDPNSKSERKVNDVIALSVRAVDKNLNQLENFDNNTRHVVSGQHIEERNALGDKSYKPDSFESRHVKIKDYIEKNVNISELEKLYGAKFLGIRDVSGRVIDENLEFAYASPTLVQLVFDKEIEVVQPENDYSGYNVERTEENKDNIETYSGYAFYDENKNFIKDEGERPYVGLELQPVLLLDDGPKTLENLPPIFTDENGKYEINFDRNIINYLYFAIKLPDNVKLNYKTGDRDSLDNLVSVRALMAGEYVNSHKYDTFHTPSYISKNTPAKIYDWMYVLFANRATRNFAYNFNATFNSGDYYKFGTNVVTYNEVTSNGDVILKDPSYDINKDIAGGNYNFKYVAADNDGIFGITKANERVNLFTKEQFLFDEIGARDANSKILSSYDSFRLDVPLSHQYLKDTITKADLEFGIWKKSEITKNIPGTEIQKTFLRYTKATELYNEDGTVNVEKVSKLTRDHKNGTNQDLDNFHVGFRLTDVTYDRFINDVLSDLKQVVDITNSERWANHLAEVEKLKTIVLDSLEQDQHVFGFGAPWDKSKRVEGEEAYNKLKIYGYDFSGDYKSIILAGAKKIETLDISTLDIENMFQGKDSNIGYTNFANAAGSGSSGDFHPLTNLKLIDDYDYFVANAAIPLYTDNSHITGGVRVHFKSAMEEDGDLKLRDSIVELSYETNIDTPYDTAKYPDLHFPVLEYNAKKYEYVPEPRTTRDSAAEVSVNEPGWLDITYLYKHVPENEKPEEPNEEKPEDPENDTPPSPNTEKPELDIPTEPEEEKPEEPKDDTPPSPNTEKPELEIPTEPEEEKPKVEYRETLPNTGLTATGSGIFAAISLAMAGIMHRFRSRK